MVFKLIMEKVRTPLTFCCSNRISTKYEKLRLIKFCNSVTHLPHAKVKFTPGDDIYLLFPLKLNTESSSYLHVLKECQCLVGLLTKLCNFLY